MDIKYLEKQFLDFWKHCYGNQEISFYVPTDEHSSGFNEIKIEPFEAEGGYYLSIENTQEAIYEFEDIIEEFPKIVLDKKYAFEGKFVSWEDIELAFKGEKEKWIILKEFIKSEMNKDKVSVEDSCYFQLILNKMYELECDNNEKVI